MRLGSQGRSLDRVALERLRERAEQFLLLVSEGDDGARLTPNAETTSYALCFRVFLASLLKRLDLLDREACATRLIKNIREARRASESALSGKPYRQLLTFTLSALAALNVLDRDPLEDLVLEQLVPDVEAALRAFGALDGVAGAGNQAMFLAIFMIHAGAQLGQDVSAQIAQWGDCHMKAMNRRGFWSRRSGMTHLEFQNGYHQYEIFEYLGSGLSLLEETKKAVVSVGDSQGHFAPYPGGGGCHDYDAVHILTFHEQNSSEAVLARLETTALTLLAEQNPDGGFCESKYVAPWTASGFLRHARHVLASPGADALKERARYWLALMRPRNQRIHTHWSQYSRAWHESDLWDTWFRIMAIARVDAFFNPERALEWGFIDFPGIGFHPSVREKSRVAE